MKTLAHIILFLTYTTLFAQNSDAEYLGFSLRIPNPVDAPTVLSKTDTEVLLAHPNPAVQAILDSYTITSFEKLTQKPTRNAILQEVYTLYCKDIQLMNDLQTNFPNLFHSFEAYYMGPTLSITTEFEKKPIKPTSFPVMQHWYSYFNELLENNSFTPNDYGLRTAQTELDLINAQKAWSFTTGNRDVILGVTDEPFDTSHDDLKGTIFAYNGYTTTVKSHGTAVANVMAGHSNNGIRLASIGSDCFLYGVRLGSSIGISHLVEAGAKVINGSWGKGAPSAITQYDIIRMVIEEYTFPLDNSLGTSFVFAGGNGIDNGTTKRTDKLYPAAYEHVISVASVQHNPAIAPPDSHYCLDQSKKYDQITHTHNYDIDIAAPGYYMPLSFENTIYMMDNGTSFAAPLVSGTLGLMLSVNYSLTPIERETILKLSSANIYHVTPAPNPNHNNYFPENEPYLDMLGAGRLDAGKAVEMAYQMAQEQDTLVISGRDFYRDWFFEIKNAPYAITIENQTFRDSIRAEFTARNFISLEKDVLLEPTGEGYIEFKIDPNIPIAQNGPPEGTNTFPVEPIPTSPSPSLITITPNYLFDTEIVVDVDAHYVNNQYYFEIYDFSTNEIRYQKQLVDAQTTIDVSSFEPSLYYFKIQKGWHYIFQRVFEKTEDASSEIIELMTIFPNPFSNTLNISIDTSLIGSRFYLLHILEGRNVVNNVTLTNENTSIDTSTFPSGTYTVSLYQAANSDLIVSKQLYKN